MNIDKSVWRTGIWAVVATIGFSIVVFRAADQSRDGLPDLGTVGLRVSVIPQIVAGSFDGGASNYSTVIQVLNTGPSTINVTGDFYDQTGAVSTLQVNANGSAFAGTLPSASLEPNAMLVFTTGSPAVGVINWARIVTTGNASVSSYYELRDGITNVLYNRAGVDASIGNLSAFVVPRIRNVATGLDVGFALVNTGRTEASITGTVRDASGAVIATRIYTMAAGAHTSGFTREFFSASCSPCLLTEPVGMNYSSVTFNSVSPQFAAIALSIEGGSLASFPVHVLR
jgi:hypothetical protein